MWLRNRYNFLIALVSLALGLAFAYTRPGVYLDGFLFDNSAPLWGHPRPTDKYMAVLISESDYKAAATPLALWGTNLAPLLEKIAADQPKAIGLDLLLPQFPLGHFLPDHDRRFFKALSGASRACRLVSGYGITPSGTLQEPFLIYQKILGMNGYGFFNLTVDDDGVCRRQVIALDSSAGRTLYSFAAMLAGVKPSPGAFVTPDWRNPLVIPILSFKDALAADKGKFSGKTIIVGTNFAFEDRFPNPAAGTMEAGAVIQARVAEALANKRFLRDPGTLPSLMIPAGLALLALLAVSSQASALKAMLTGLAVMAGLVIICAAALAIGIVLRPSAVILGLLLVTMVRIFQGYLSVKETFGRYVSSEVRDEILSGRIPLDGELKEVSVLFADLRGFTPLTESNPPREVVKLINAYFQEMSRVIREKGGLVLQYVGDEIMAVFGAPVPAEDHAQRAVLAAIAMRDRLNALNQTLQKRGQQPLRHGIGVNSGQVVAGNIGGGDRLSYALVGDTVNLGSRIQGLNKVFQTEILISARTRERIGNGMRLKPLPPTTVKGKKEPVEIFEVL